MEPMLLLEPELPTTRYIQALEDCESDEGFVKEINQIYKEKLPLAEVVLSRSEFKFEPCKLARMHIR
jgi:hypothetical protein